VELSPSVSPRATLTHAETLSKHLRCKTRLALRCLLMAILSKHRNRKTSLVGYFVERFSTHISSIVRTGDVSKGDALLALQVTDSMVADVEVFGPCLLTFRVDSCQCPVVVGSDGYSVDRRDLLECRVGRERRVRRERKPRNHHTVRRRRQRHHHAP
jgi:hypothetical protein